MELLFYFILLDNIFYAAPDCFRIIIWIWIGITVYTRKTLSCVRSIQLTAFAPCSFSHHITKHQNYLISLVNY